MLIHPWDAATNAEEWRDWLAGTDRFGVLVVNNRDHAQAPIAVPTHFTLDATGEALLVHLARPNPAWAHLEAAAEARMVTIGDYAFIPGHWRAPADAPVTSGVPTSYYTAVQFVCRPTVVDDPADKAALLTSQLGDFQPEGQHALVSADDGPFARLLPGIRGVRLHLLRVEAKFKYDDNKPVEQRERVLERLADRDRGLDPGAAKQQRRRLDAIGDWKERPRR